MFLNSQISNTSYLCQLNSAYYKFTNEVLKYLACPNQVFITAEAYWEIPKMIKNITNFNIITDDVEVLQTMDNLVSMLQKINKQCNNSFPFIIDYYLNTTISYIREFMPYEKCYNDFHNFLYEIYKQNITWKNFTQIYFFFYDVYNDCVPLQKYMDTFIKRFMIFVFGPHYQCPAAASQLYFQFNDLVIQFYNNSYGDGEFWDYYNNFFDQWTNMYDVLSNIQQYCKVDVGYIFNPSYWEEMTYETITDVEIIMRIWNNYKLGFFQVQKAVEQAENKDPQAIHTIYQGVYNMNYAGNQFYLEYCQYL